jgi:ABC-2 type transport system permease protein
MGGILVFFAGLALFFSMVLPSRRMASMVSGIVLIGGFFINGLANISDTLSDIAPFLPLYYYQGDTWPDGLDVNALLILTGFGFGFMLVAWGAFLRRDIRVGGEGGWKFKLPRFLRRRAAEA